MKEDTGDLSVEDQLLRLRALSDSFECLHEAQVLQLRCWPFAVDPKLDKSTANVDFKKKQVTFYWYGPGYKPDKGYGHRLSELNRSVKFLLGDAFGIQVFYNKDSIFFVNGQRSSSKKRVANPRTPKRPRKV